MDGEGDWREAYDIFEARIGSGLKKLTTSEALFVFGLQCALQLYPRYLEYQWLNGISDSQFIRETLLKLWNQDWPVDISEQEISDLKTKILRLAPHALDISVDVPIIRADFGQAVCVAINGILDFPGQQIFIGERLFFEQFRHQGYPDTG